MINKGPQVTITNADIKIMEMFLQSKTTIYTTDLTEQQIFDEVIDYLYNNSDDENK